jgi:micrococcal nuclease
MSSSAVKAAVLSLLLMIGLETGLHIFGQTPLVDSGVVTAVFDGDTVQVKFSDGESRRVRLIGVDAPEIGDPREDIALWAHLAKRFAFFHLYRKTVSLSYDLTSTDKYGRVLAYVHTGGGEIFNEFIIRSGFAFAYLEFPFRSDYQERFSRAQEEARKEERGLWLKGEPEVIAAIQTRAHLGRLVSVRFICSAVADKGSMTYFRSSGGDFEAVIPRDRRRQFPDAASVEDRVLIVTGFLEAYAGRPQIMLFFARQLKVIPDSHHLSFPLS